MSDLDSSRFRDWNSRCDRGREILRGTMSNTAMRSRRPNAARSLWQYCHNAPEAPARHPRLELSTTVDPIPSGDSGIQCLCGGTRPVWPTDEAYADAPGSSDGGKFGMEPPSRSHYVSDSPLVVREGALLPVVRRRLDEAREQPARRRVAVDEGFRMPLDSDEIGAVRALDALDETVRRN